MDATNHSSAEAGPHHYPGMPALKPVRRVTSFFEFWPAWLIYLPIAAAWLLLAIRYRGLTLPLLVNHTIPLGGMVGESKSQILNLAGNTAQAYIAPFYRHFRHAGNIQQQADSIETALKAQRILYPFVAKPDQGCRGAGVQKVTNRQDLEAYLAAFPISQTIIFQRLCRWQPEAGVFYVREGSGNGRIVSLTLKYPAIVVGDGQRDIATLIADDPRASKIADLYRARFSERLGEVPGPGEVITLSFAGNHCRGALFRNGNEWITPAMTQAVDHLMKDVDGFCYGRLDIRFANINHFQRGQDFEIIEINGVSSEAAHIWDPDTSLGEVYRVLYWQYATLFRIGASLRAQGHKPPSLWQFWRAWRDDSALNPQYPPTH